MKFLITMNMPARSGVPIHQIICEYLASGIADFCESLESHDFLLVEEFYRNIDGPPGTDPYYSVGMTALNHRYIGKVKEMGTQTHANRGKKQEY